MTLPPFVKPSQPDDPPIPGPSPSSEPHEDISTCEPEPELLVLHPLHNHHQQYARQIPPCVPPPSTPTQEIPPIAPKNPTANSLNSNNEACQEFTDRQATLMIPQSIVNKSINQILLEHCQLLHMIPFVDVTHQNEMHQEFQEELNSLLGQALEAYSKEDIIRIVSKYLYKKNKKNCIISSFYLS
ncbi:hypothetical protein O181_059624 [Austropuccinia psidii MF-1]|uniref:Uncharacterized protein n=1 Tax=Austropuccinia psidii MF-1 TaxID=1389203 RepID=A0A9Q3HYT7_9BASI|nr:hypothetical protein [Austropuccinia psidii MF-1]